jgi:Leucine-rich repeat (LRR) protein
MAWVELFYKLRVLDLTKNNITYIEGLANLKYLEKLDLSQNLITKIENL